MKDRDIHKLRERYEKALEEGVRSYFEPEELEAIADSYEQEFSYRKALQVVAYGLELYPSNESLILSKARSLLALGRIEEATQTLTHIVEHSIEYYFVRGELELLRNDVEAALYSFSQIVYTPDCTIEDCLGVLDVCTDMEHIELLERFTPIVERAFNDATPYLRELALLYDECEEGEKAVVLFNKILDINSFSTDDWFSLAKVHARMKEYDKALEACDFALAIEENDESVIAFKGYCYYDSGQYVEAVEQFKLFLQITADKAVAYELIGEAYGRMDKHEEAVEYLLQAVALNDRSHDLYYQLAVNYYYMGHNDTAIMYLHKAVACDDTDDEAHIFLGELLLQNGSYEEAYQHLLRVDRKPVTDTVSAVAYADVCVHMQRYDEALEVLLQLTDKEPYEPHYLFDIILCYLQLNDYENAARWVAHSEKLSNNTEMINSLDEASQRVWKSIGERIEQLRNILRVYLNENL